VTITPNDAITSGALWSVNNGSKGWHKSEEIITLLPGKYVVTFKAIAGWTKPCDKKVTITKNHLTTITRQYKLLPTGQLQVTITPNDAITSGALWSVNNGSKGWYKSEEIITLPPGKYAATFNAIVGWTKPCDKK